MKQALLIIDVQKLLCSGAEAAFDIERVLDRINSLAVRARAAGLPVVLIQHEDDGPLRHGSEGWQLDERLAVDDSDIRLRKTACDSFHQTTLQALLHQRGIEQLIVCGLQTDFCVDTTVRRALALGYPVVLASDGHSTLDNGVLTAAQIIAHHNRNLSCIESFGPRVMTRKAADVELVPV